MELTFGHILRIIAFFALSGFAYGLGYFLSAQKYKRQHQSTKNYHNALMQINERMVKVSDPSRLARMIAQNIQHHIQANHVGILIKEFNKDCYVFRASQGIDQIPPGLIKIDQSRPFIQWFEARIRKDNDNQNVDQKEPTFLTFSEVHLWLEQRLRSKRDPEKILQVMTIYEEMKRFQAAIAIPCYYQHKCLAILLIGEKSTGAAYDRDDLEQLVALSYGYAIAVHNAELISSLRDSNDQLKKRIQEVESLQTQERVNMRQMVLALAESVEAKDEYTGGHVDTVTQIGIGLGKRVYQKKGIDFSQQKKELLLTALRLHDVGKIGVPDHILKKPGKLDPKEWEIMRDHVNIAARILAPLKDFRDAAYIVQHHHESWDGSGYPHRLKGEEIPLEVRIITLVDAYHAMVSDRTYRKGISIQEAIKRIKAASGIQFDPEIVNIFLEMLKESVQEQVA
jgi:HD-GYP domain-containing protein (c-di-GMP phosphodiesterase class II)